MGWPYDNFDCLLVINIVCFHCHLKNTLNRVCCVGRTILKCTFMILFPNYYFWNFLLSMSKYFTYKKIIVYVFFICFKPTETQTECIIVEWSKLNEIFWVFMLVGPLCGLCRTARFFNTTKWKVVLTTQMGGP